MKKIFLLSAFTLLFGVVTNAQSFTLETPMGAPVMNGDTLVFYAPSGAVKFEEHVYVTNSSSSTLNVKAKKTELSVVDGTTNYFCWGECLPPFLFEAEAMEMTSGFTETGFTCDYWNYQNTDTENNHDGVTFIMYTFWDVDNPSDSIAFVAQYRVGDETVGINTSLPEVSISNAYPNPAKNLFYLDYSFENTQTAKVEILNIVGGVVKQYNIQGMSGRAGFDISDLNNGVYFYNVVVDEIQVSSKKLVIQR